MGLAPQRYAKHGGRCERLAFGAIHFPNVAAGCVRVGRGWCDRDLAGPCFASRGGSGMVA